jgi:hypothetical protein
VQQGKSEKGSGNSGDGERSPKVTETDWQLAGRVKVREPENDVRNKPSLIFQVSLSTAV